LFLTCGVPVTGFLQAFGGTFGFGHIFGVPVTVAITIVERLQPAADQQHRRLRSDVRRDTLGAVD
jgi:hypothetical protein